MNFTQWMLAAALVGLLLVTVHGCWLDGRLDELQLRIDEEHPPYVLPADPIEHVDGVATGAPTAEGGFD